MPMARITPAHITRARQILESGLGLDQVSQMLANTDAAEAELAWFRRVYSLFEEMSPPDVPRPEFVKWCFEAWEKQCEQKQEAAEPTEGG